MNARHAAKPTAPAGARRTNSALLFMRQFLRSPGSVGAVAPSSRFLAQRMVEGVDFSRVSAVVEFGPGAGVVTHCVVDRLAPGATFFAMEFNPAMAREFAHRFPNVKLHVRSAAEVREACVEEGLAPDNSLDLIISGLPWAAFPSSLQESILTAAVKALRPGGMMATFAYYQGLLLPAGKRFAASLPNYFSRVERSAPVWLNVPPAFVYRCYK